MKLSKLTLSLLFAVSASGLVGCQTLNSKSLGQPDANIPAAFAAGSAGASNAVILQGYQKFFNQPELVSVITLALEHNRDVESALLNIERAKNLYQISQNNQLPTLDGHAGYSRGEQLGMNQPTSSSNLSVGVTSYELDFFGKTKNLKEAALNQYLASDEAMQTVQINLIGEISKAWLAMAYHQDQHEIARNTMLLQAKSYDLNKKKFQAGVISEVAVRQSETLMHAAEEDMLTIQTTIKQDQNLINLLAGTSIPEALLPKAKVLHVSSADLNQVGLPSDLLINRPDLKQAEFQLAAAGANINVARAKLFPSISLTGSAGFASTDLSDLFDKGVWSFGPQIDMPIFDYGTRKKNLAISKINYEIRLAEYEKSIQTAFKEVNDVLVFRASIDSRVKAQQQLVQASQVTYNLAQARFKAGIDSYLNVLDAHRSLYTAQQALSELQLQKVSSEVDLYKTLGGGLS